MYIARILYPVKVLGPGERIGIWMDGCEHRCKGCSNPELWDIKNKYKTNIELVSKMINSIRENWNVEGFTLTGGDPFYQVDALEELLPYFSSINKDILVYTGYSYETVKEKYGHLLKYIAVLIDGKYIEEQNTGAVLKGSDNQKIYILKEEYKEKYAVYLRQEHSRIQNFTLADGVISVGIHLPGYEKSLQNEMKKRGLEGMDNGGVYS